jgi:hypothetical protein
MHVRLLLLSEREVSVMTVRFDDSLPIFARIIAAELGEATLASGVVLRDAVGRLAFFSNTYLDDAVIERTHQRIQAELGPYARTDRSLATFRDYGADTVLNDRSVVRIPVAGRRIRLVDRRLVGADWLRVPAPVPPPPPRFVFASLKGGVGRSTALSVAAADLASKGYRVLVVDLDMEAPGLGTILLDENTLPLFGTIDALVECGLGPLDQTFLADMVGPSSLADQRGRIDVVPAFGSRSVQNPGDVLAKIARAYVEGIRPDGTVSTILDHVRDLIDAFAEASRYDAIFVDTRAGLHETTASAILGLGAEVFLFGLDEPQTFQGYSALLAHLARFVNPGEPAPEWLARITMIHGKAPSDLEERAGFADKCRNLFASAGLGPSVHAVDEVQLPAGSFSDVPWNDEASDQDVLFDEQWKLREPVAILDEDTFRRFNPLHRRDLLSHRVYMAAFGDFLEHVFEIVVAEGGDPNGAGR